MAQFDVHRNHGRSREGIPFVVIVQSALSDGYNSRVVVPLVKKSYLNRVSYPRFNPIFGIKDIPVVLHPLEILSIPKDKPGKFVGSLAKDNDRIIDALDELVSRAGLTGLVDGERASEGRHRKTTAAGSGR